MMKILFLNPPFIDRFSRTVRRPPVGMGDTTYYPLWLAYAAGVAEKAGHEARLLDAPLEGLHLQGLHKSEDIMAPLGDFIPDIVVSETSAYTIYNDIDVIETIKNRHPDTFIVMVGTYPSALPEETLKLSRSIGAVAVGEYDYIIRDLAESLKHGRSLNTVDGLFFRGDDEVIQNRKRNYIKNLDELPFVSSVYKKHLNYLNYFSSVADYPVMMIVTSRGCPYQCPFCVYPQVLHGNNYRARSAENVVTEFEYITHNFPDIKEIGIEDDCFNIDNKRVKDICKLLIEKKLDVKWYCNVRGDLGFDLLKLMREAGCSMLSVGFESGCQTVLNNIHKKVKVEQYHEVVKDAKRVGIHVQGCFMMGNPGDTMKTLSQSYKFAKKLNCDSVRFYPLFLYPGTEALHWAQKKGYVKRDVFAEWLREDGLDNCVLHNPELPPEDMVYLSDYYEKRYYLRPQYLFMKFMQSITKPAEIVRNLKAAKLSATNLLEAQIHRSR